MIAQIDRLRNKHNVAITEAMHALNDLQELVHFEDAQKIVTAYVGAVAAVDVAANEAINSLAQAQHKSRRPGSMFFVHGDMIQVGDVIDSHNIAIGKDIKQDD